MASQQLYLVSLCATFFNGTFPCVLKLPHLNKYPKNNIMATLWLATGILLSSLLLYPASLLPSTKFNPNQDINLNGILSGLILLCAFHCTVVAVRQIDVTLAITIWSGTSILMSIVWGLFQNKAVKDQLSLGCGIFSILFGLIVLSQMRQIVEGNEESEDDYVRLSVSGIENNSQKSNLLNQTMGIAFSILTGVFGGSVQASKIILGKLNVLEDKGDFNLIFNMSVCIYIASFMITFVQWMINRTRKNFVSQCSVEQSLTHIISGSLYNFGNITITQVLNFLSQEIAGGIFQCSLVFGVFWGLFYFGEFDGENKMKQILLTFVMITVIICGFICINLSM